MHAISTLGVELVIVSSAPRFTACHLITLVRRLPFKGPDIRYAHAPHISIQYSLFAASNCSLENGFSNTYCQIFLKSVIVSLRL